MAPRNSSPSRPAASPVLCGARRPTGGDGEYICNFCPRGFKTGNGLSGHYNKHKDIDHDLWVLLGPKGSKIRKDILQARCEGKTYEYKKRVWPVRAGKGKARSKALARTPEPIRATQPQSASPGPQARVVRHVIRVQGRGGLLVVKNQRADFILTNPRARLQEAGPVVKIPGPGGLLVRRDFVALSDGAGKTSPVVWGQGPGVGSSSIGGAGVADPPEGCGPGLLESNFPASRLIRSIGKEIIIID